ncbi:MAG: hypothetical protein KJO38_05890, partial [Gammaproteobacteria bacterium]|nr:hypothetical protein [Gammaproteobacteria bacterium]
MTTFSSSGTRTALVRAITEIEIMLGAPSGYTGGPVAVGVNTIAKGDLIFSASGFGSGQAVLNANVGIRVGSVTQSSASDQAVLFAPGTNALSS